MTKGELKIGVKAFGPSPDELATLGGTILSNAAVQKTLGRPAIACSACNSWKRQKTRGSERDRPVQIYSAPLFTITVAIERCWSTAASRTPAV